MKYWKTLKDLLLPFPNAKHNENWIFLEHIVFIHSSNKRETWLSDENIRLMPCSGRSPDLVLTKNF